MTSQAKTMESADGYRAWVQEGSDEQTRYVALVDPSRYATPDACARALGLKSCEFEALPNLYAKYAISIRERGPRLWELAESNWDRACEESLGRQALSFLVVPRTDQGLEDHLSGLIRMPHPDGSNVLFRFQDVTVLGSLAPLLSSIQRRALLGPARHWLMADVCRRPVRIDAPGLPAQAVPALRLNQAQMTALGEALLPLAIIFQANETDRSLLANLDKCEQVELIRERMRRARGHDLTREDDIALYCVLSLQLAEGFDQDGPVADALHASRTHGISFGEAIDEVPVDRWRTFDDVLENG